jgi:hypothetical protein
MGMNMGIGMGTGWMLERVLWLDCIRYLLIN